MKRLPLILAVALLTACMSSGCVLTKVVTVPMRVVGAVVSIVPVAGNSADGSIDAVADKIDEVPI